MGRLERGIGGISGKVDVIMAEVPAIGELPVNTSVRLAIAPMTAPVIHGAGTCPRRIQNITHSYANCDIARKFRGAANARVGVFIVRRHA
jgi:hypothetical protein